MRIRRNLEKHGSESGAGTLYNRLLEGKCEAEFEFTMDFINKTQLNQFLNATKIYVDIECPSGSGGRKITLSTSGDAQGVFRTMRKPARELDLINLTLLATFDTIAVTTL